MRRAEGGESLIEILLTVAAVAPGSPATGLAASAASASERPSSLDTASRRAPSRPVGRPVTRGAAAEVRTPDGIHTDARTPLRRPHVTGAAAS
jgi:hypothetical protein